MLSPKTKLVSLVHVSNMTGAVLPVADVVEDAHKVCNMLHCLTSMPTSGRHEHARWPCIVVI